MIFSTGVILFRIDGIIEWSWLKILIIPHCAVIAIFLFLFYRLTTTPYRRCVLRFTFLAVNIVILSFTLSPYWISLFWIYTDNYFENILSINVLLNFTFSCLGLYLHKEITYVFCKNWHFKIVERKT